MVVYRVIDLTNGLIYIGKTTLTLNERIKKHLDDCKWRKNDNTYFHNAIRKHGQDNFKWEIMCECNSKEELNEKEKYYIKEYNSHCTKNGYNLTWGGDGGDTFTNNPNREKIREKYIGKNSGKNNPMYGKGNLICGKNNPNSKIYRILYPSGYIEIVECLKTWCCNNNFPYCSVKSYMYKNKKYNYDKLYKGFLIKEI